MATREKRYWGFRIDMHHGDEIADFLRQEIDEGRLRMGWGHNPEQNIRTRDQHVDYWEHGADDASSNVRIFEEVKKGDVLLVPRAPDWGKVSVVKATEDFDKGYRFEQLSQKHNNDYGHIFPVKFVTGFVRNSEHVMGGIRSTLRTPLRFWNLDGHRDDVEHIIKNQNDLDKSVTPTDRIKSQVGQVFESKIRQEIIGVINCATSDIDWEFFLVDVLRKLFPQYDVERVGGRSEVNHGTDILIKIPALAGEYQHGIAIQVKDYAGHVDEGVITQINKSDDYWPGQGVNIIEKVVVLTKAKRNENSHLVNNDSGVNFIFADELNQLLFRYVKKYIGEQSDEE